MSNDPKKNDELIGKRFGQFEIIEEIGRGGMATVYKARQASMNRTVAIKVLPRQMLHDPGFYERFEREVDVIAHLEHPHILPIYDFGRAEDVPYIAMRYLGGGSLEQRLRRGVMRIDELEKPLLQIAQALDYAHQQGIIHRDLKPGNIMLDESGNAYLSDFGIARVLGSDLTGSMIIGTPSYMSPEQANGLPIDGRSDIYSLGVVVFELLSGRGPFQAETPMAVLLKHITEPLPSIREIRRDIPLSVENVIRKSTEKDPDARYSSAGDFAHAYRAALLVDDTEAMPPITSSRKPTTHSKRDVEVATMLETKFPSMGMVAPSGKSASSLPKIILGIVLLLMLVGGGIGIALSIGGDDGPGGPPRNIEPTAFPLADVIRDDNYTISMPRDWIPRNGDFFTDLSDERGLIHAWYDLQGDTYISLALIELGETPFEDAMNAYSETYYDVPVLQFIDEETAEDGTLRWSYYVDAGADGFDIGTIKADTDRQPLTFPGQLDVFFSNQNSKLVVVEFYTSDSAGNSNVARLQLILDSLRVNDPSAQNNPS